MHKNKIAVLFWVLSAFIFSGAFLPASSEAMGLIIKPSKIRLSISPGTSQRGVVEVQNNSDVRMTLNAYLEDWQYSTQEGTKDFLPAGTTPLSAASWINFAPADFAIPPYGKQIVGFTVTVPQDASGGHYAVLFFETALQEPPRADISLEQTSGASVSIAGRIRTLFYIESAGTVKKKFGISNLTVARNSNADPLEVAFDLNNTGNVDITSGGTFHIMDKQGVIYARNEFNDTYSLPNGSVKLRSLWKDRIPKGRYDLVITLDLSRGAQEKGARKGDVVLREAKIEIGSNGEVLSVGELK